MKEIYDLLDKIKDRLRANNITNTVTFGDILEVDLTKTTIYPLSHLTIGNVVFGDYIMTADVSVLSMDVVDVNKNESTFDSFYKNDNLQDVLNTQLSVVNDLQSHLRRGNLFENNDLKIVGDVTAEPFQDRFENQLAGWGVTFSIEMPNDNFDICE
tara:strand:+ start:368 stop:835 length:468 start_codon:yes stop_codon:yes gene_type:complete